MRTESETKDMPLIAETITGERKPIRELLVFIEPECIACEQVLETVGLLQKSSLVERLVVIDRTEDPESCQLYGVVIFPATFINGKLVFYGEFSVEDAKNFMRQLIETTLSTNS